ncbi:MAG: outer membrane lipoprotein chaperone LolA [Wenzhouxiangella sp.]
MIKKAMLGFCLLLPALAFADAREQLDRFAAGLASLSGEFRQVILDEDGFLVEESHGSLKFLAPDRFRWDYDEPFPQQLIADGERLWHFDIALDQVTVRAQPPAAESPLMVLTQPELLDRFYRIEPSRSADELEFTPLDGDGDFERATLRFADGLPVSLRLVDRLVGQSTMLELSKLQLNPELDPAEFTFEPPPGVDVLEGY